MAGREKKSLLSEKRVDDFDDDINKSAMTRKKKIDQKIDAHRAEMSAKRASKD